MKIYWHPQGDYLAVKVERFTKTKKSTYTGFELFSIREKDTPMDVRLVHARTHACMGPRQREGRCTVAAAASPSLLTMTA